uniref:Uncharacterized protein n=1 Tax=Astyanax mexicanus TaxID=7994 RepID=A0A8B9L7Z4_ASTMX
VVQSTCPIYSNIRLLPIQLYSTMYRNWCYTLCMRVCVCGLTALHLLAEFGHVVRSDGPQKLYIIVTVVFRHLISCETHINLHLAVETIVQQEVMSHANTVGFHWVALTVVWCWFYQKKKKFPPGIKTWEILRQTLFNMALMLSLTGTYLQSSFI